MVFNPNDWTYDASIIIDKDKVDQDLINFPVAIVLSSGTGIYNYDMTDVFTQLTSIPSIDQYTKFLFYCTGDQSPSKHIITSVGNPQLLSFNNNDNNPVLYNSAYFDGSSAYLTIPDSIITTSTSTFTIDAWLFLMSSVTVADHSPMIGDAQPAGVNNYWSFGPDDEDKLIFRWWDGSTHVAQSTNTLSLDKWVHIAVSVNSNTIKLFINGIEETIVGTSTLTNRSSTLNSLPIGVYDSNYLDAYIASIRITNTYEYSGNFTPPRSYTSDTNTKLLIDFTETGWGQGNTPATFTDSGDTGHTVTNVSSNVSGCTFWWGAAMDFDGTGDYVSAPNSEDFVFDTNNFTIDVWVCPQQTGKHQRLFSRHTGALGWLLSINNTNTITYINGTVSITSTYTIQVGVWVHVAVVRDGNDWDLYINGVSEDSTIVAASSIDSDITVQFGRVAAQTGYDLNGYASGARITKGEALWTSNFNTDLPYGPYTTNSGTKLLLGFDGDTSASGHTVVFPGNNPRMFSSKGPFDGSYYFDGNDYMYMADNPDWDFGSDDFTIDLWANFDDNTARRALFGKWNAGTNNRSIMLTYRGDQSPDVFRILVSSDGSTFSEWLTTTWTPTINTWYHIALVRKDLVFILYIDGILLDTYTTFTSSINTSTDYFRIALEDAALSSYFKGCMSALRISKGIARWTSNFLAAPEPYDYSWHNRKKIAVTTTVTGVETEIPVEIEDWSENYVTRYPTEFSTNTVKSTSYFNTSYYPWFAVDPTKNLTGTITDHSWASGSGQHTNQKFNVDLGIEKIIKRILLHNACHLGSSYTDNGIYNFSVYGTNSVTAFNNTTYSNVTNLDLIGTFQARQHVLEDIEDSQYFYLNNNNAYRYYILRIADDFGGAADATVIRHIEFQEYIEEAVLWAKVPTVTSGVNTELNLYYDSAQEDNNYVDPNIKLLIQDSFNNNSAFEHSVTVNGNPDLLTFNANENPLLNNSAFFDGSSAYLSAPDSNDWYFAGDPVTLDCWVNFNTVASTSPFISQTIDDDNRWHIIWNSATNRFVLYVRASSITYAHISYVFTPSVNKWYHIAFVRNGTSTYFFVNGEELSQEVTTSMGSSEFPDLSTPLFVGRGRSSSSWQVMQGYMASVRVSKGVALWTSNFTPPLLYTSDTNTKLLIDFTESGWGQGNTPATFTDSGDTGYTVTNVSSNVSGCTFWWGRVLDFDGIGDHLTIPTHNDIIYGDGDFTVSFWVKLTTNGRNYIACHVHTSSDPDSQMFIYTNPSSLIGAIVYSSSTGYIAGFDNTLVVDRWYHLAAARNGTAFTLYVDGVAQATTADLTGITLNTPITDMTIGYRDVSTGTDALDGCIADLKCIKGTALYTSNFTPPSQLTDIGYIGDIGSAQATNVWNYDFAGVYHMNQDPSGGTDCILDSTHNKYNGTPQGTMTSEDLVIGSGTIGRGIMFDNTDDYIQNSGPLYPTTLTLYCNIDIYSIGTTQTILHQGDAAVSSNQGTRFNIDNSGYLSIVYFNGSWRSVYSTIAVTVGHHNISVKINSSTLKCIFDIDGSQDEVSMPVALITSTYSFKIGATKGASMQNFFDGIIDEVRVVNTYHSNAWLKVTHYSNSNQLMYFAEYMPGIPTTFYFSNPIPVHLSTVYGTTKQLYLTVSVSGSSPSYIYDASFYNGAEQQIGSTVSGVSSGQPASIGISTSSSGIYTWYVTAISSGTSDTSSTYQFTNRFLCEGYVEEQGVRTSGIPVRLHRRSDGEVIGNDVSSTVSGTFAIATDYNEEHYVVALHTDTTYNALIYDRITP